MAAEVRLLARQQALLWEPIGALFGTAIMVTGTEITSIIGTTAAAGSAHQMEDPTWCHPDIAVDACDHYSRSRGSIYILKRCFSA